MQAYAILLSLISLYVHTYVRYCNKCMIISCHIGANAHEIRIHFVATIDSRMYHF